MPRVNDPRWFATNKDGTPMVGAKLTAYDASTNNLASIFYDAALQVHATNPLLSNDRGQFPIFFATTGVTLNIIITAPNDITVSEVLGLTI